MEYRTWQKAEVSPSLLGFGCMRFPTNEDGSINKEKTYEMLDYAMKMGVTYYDTAYTYHNKMSEKFIGEYFTKYERESFYFATKLPLWLVKTEEDVERIVREQLDNLQTDYIDFYLVHAMDKERLAWMEKMHAFEKLMKYKEDGVIRHLGFSFHDNFDTFEKILTSYPWDFCQIQYNYMDTDYQAGTKGLKLAGQLGIPVVVMEPVRGGSLLRLPEDILQLFKEHNPEASYASWPLRWVADHPEVKVILSGMSTEEQVVDNIHTFTEFGVMTEGEKEVIAKAKVMIEKRQKNRCTGCEYCMPCPHGVDIPYNFKYWNDDSMFLDGTGKRHYKGLGNERAIFCKECGKCEAACPQHISIREDLKKVARDFEDERD